MTAAFPWVLSECPRRQGRFRTKSKKLRFWPEGNWSFRNSGTGPELPFPAPLDRRGACCRAGSSEPHLSSSVRGEGRPPCFAAPSWFTQHPGQLSIGSHHWTPAWGLLYVCFICHLLLWPGRVFAWLTGGRAGNSGRGAVEPGRVQAVAWPGSCPSCVLHVPDAAFSRKGGRAEEWWR